MGNDRGYRLASLALFYLVNMITRRHLARLSLFSLGLGLANCATRPQIAVNPTLTDNDADLIIWWEQGYLPEENAGVARLVQQWERASGRKAILKLMHISVLQQELLKAVAAPDRYVVPDVVFAISLDANLAPKLAWENQLMDVADILEQHQGYYASDALRQVTYRNQVRRESGYYAIPIGNAGEYIHCWQSYLAEIGLTPQDIPQDWVGFWRFWQGAQPLLRHQGHPELYGIGLCMSASGVDTFTSLRWFLDAHGATVVSDDGELVFLEPENRQIFIDVLEEYTGFYRQGFVPPDALNWTASGNNARFLEGGILMTHNPTLSIPLTQKLVANQYNQDANQRYRKIATLNWPDKLDGTPMQPRKGIKQVVLLKAGRHPQAARDFATYLIEPTNLNQLLKDGFKGRFLPVTSHLFSDPYWQNPSDKHLAIALEIQEQPSPVSYEILHPAYSQILGQQVWGQTVLRILDQKESPEQAADWAMVQIQNIWTEWEAEP